MVKVNPTSDVDQFELNRKLRHACPRIKRWKSRIDDADGDVNRMREQAINRSPVYVAIQRGSRNIQIRTRTKPKWWRKWIQEGKRYGFDESFATPIHIPSDAYRYQRQVSFSKRSQSLQSSPRRSLPVSPVKTGIHSPIKVSYLKNEQYVRSPKKESQQKNVPLLVLTPVPLNQVLKKKARIIGHLSSTFGKGRWVDQDSSHLAVPGKPVYQYDSSSETEDERERQKKGGEILNKLISPPTPTETLQRRLSAKRRETPPSPKSPKKTPKIEVKEVSETESESDSNVSVSQKNQRIKRKIRAAGQTSLMFAPKIRERLHEDLIEESEEDREDREEEVGRMSSARKSAALRKIKATGTVRAALSPHKSPPQSPTKSPPKSPQRTPMTPTDMKKKIKAIGQTRAALSPRKGEPLEYDEEGNDISPDITQEPSPSSIGSIFRKIKTLARLSSTPKGPDASPSGISSLMTKMRFLMKLSPRKSKMDSIDEETEEGSDDEMKKKKIKEKSIKDETDIDEEEDEVMPKESCFRRVCGIICPCICRKKEPVLMEYESGSQVNY